MLNCALLDDYQNCALGFADWTSLKDVTVKTFTKYIPPNEVAKELADFDVVVAMRERTVFDARVFDALPRLKLLVTTGMKNSAIDMDAAKQHGVVVCGTKSLPYPAPELSWALLLALVRHIPVEAASLRAGGWQTSVGVGLNGKTLGIVGFGQIGKRMAKVAQAFEMKVLAWQPKVNEEDCKAAGIECATSLEDLMRRSDAVTVHMVLAESTRGMIRTEHLACMKPTAFFVNAARGPLVDEEALIKTPSGKADRRRRAGRLRHRTAACRPSLPYPSQCAGRPAPRLCHTRELRDLLRRGGRRHSAVDPRSSRSSSTRDEVDGSVYSK